MTSGSLARTQFIVQLDPPMVFNEPIYWDEFAKRRNNQIKGRNKLENDKGAREVLWLTMLQMM